MSDDRHTCDRRGPLTRVVDESRDEPMTGIYPSCSVCGVPRIFPPEFEPHDVQLSDADLELAAQALRALAARYRDSVKRQSNPMVREGAEKHAVECERLAERSDVAKGAHIYPAHVR